ncbi:hypothetical protein [Microbacterium sp. NC79]|uniref:hypothetical protein n=1 Tax=Microbacterium sp. NC79 TaxID=2851009 RepID=UPI001C2BF367|nr:hypothetical protein [Microbacterium sp. NC79]MBV0895982.1 hypothetical protein [Microbacterium sp. NC79]
MTTEPIEPIDEDDDGLPIYLAPLDPGDVPAFCERLITHFDTVDEEGEFTFEGVDVDVAHGIWLLGLAAYDHEENLAMDPADVDRELPTHGVGGYAQVVTDWTRAARASLHAAWGEPQTRQPRLVGDEQEPEGILDYLMLSVGIAEAELWDRGTGFLALLTDWTGEVGTSELRQIAMIVPRELVLGGMAAAMSQADMADAHLMSGENIVELHRRAWLMSRLFGAGEERVRDAALDATRLSLQSRSGVTTVWNFTDDGRALVLLYDPECAFVTDAPAQFIADHTVNDTESGEPSEGDVAEAHAILVARILATVPEELRALITAPTVTAKGEVGTQPLEFVILGDQPVPLISAAVWYDGEHWNVPASLFEIGGQNGLAFDDFGLADALRRPYRLGGEFTANLFAGDDAEQNAHLEELFAMCPYPQQPRPEGDAVLGNAIPRGSSFAELAEQIERASAAWWESSPSTAAWNDHTFSIGGRELRHDERAISTVLGLANSWTVDAFATWTNSFIDFLTERWGTAVNFTVADQNTDEVRRTPLSRTMRSLGIHQGPLWWVNGHAVIVLGGIPDADSAMDPDPLAAVVIARADAVLDMMRGTRWWSLRKRARTLSELSRLTDSTLAPASTLSWAGPALPGSDVVPHAVRGAFRTNDRSWFYAFTHDARGLFLSYPLDAASLSPTIETQRDLFAGVPDDLLSLIVDRDSGGLYPLVSGVPVGDGVLRSAVSLPAVDTVVWRDDVDWRLSEGMLRRAQPAQMGSGAEASHDSGFETYLSPATGIPQLQWALGVGYDDRDPEGYADARFASFALPRPIEPATAQLAMDALGTCHLNALTGTLNHLLDVIADTPGDRHLVEAALSNPDPTNRREIALWLMRDPMPSITHQLSFLTPVNVLLENPTLGASDAVVLARMLDLGASPFPGLVGNVDPFAQLDRRAAGGTDVAKLRAVLLEAREIGTTSR